MDRRLADIEVLTGTVDKIWRVIKWGGPVLIGMVIANFKPDSAIALLLEWLRSQLTGA